MAKSGTSSLPPVRVERIDDYRWRIPRHGPMRVDGLVYADDALNLPIQSATRSTSSLSSVALTASEACTHFSMR